MKHRNEQYIATNIIDANADILTDETIFRQLAVEMIRKIPIDELKILFNLKKTEPSVDKLLEMQMKRGAFTQASDSVYIMQPDELIMHRLLETGTVLFEASIIINDKTTT